MDKTVVVFVALGFALALVATSVAPVFQQSNSQPETFTPGSGGGDTTQQNPSQCILNSESLGEGSVTACVESSFQNLNPLEILQNIGGILYDISNLANSLGQRIDAALSQEIPLDLNSSDIPFIETLGGLIESLINWGNSIAGYVPGVPQQDIDNPVNGDRELVVVVSLDSILPDWIAGAFQAVPGTLDAIGGVIGVLADEVFGLVGLLQEALTIPQRISSFIWEVLVTPIDDLRRAIVEGIDGFISDPLEETL